MAKIVGASLTLGVITPVRSLLSPVGTFIYRPTTLSVQQHLLRSKPCPSLPRTVRPNISKLAVVFSTR